MRAFTYDSLPGRVVFGPGRLAEVLAEVERLGGLPTFIIATRSAGAYLSALETRLGNGVAGVVREVIQHVPDSSIRDALEKLRECGAKSLVALGGGSAIGLAKALALQVELPIVAIPTTFSGSEMTPVYGITSQGRKKTGRDLRVLPRTVIYDPELVYNLPPALLATSGLNSLAHCVEALWMQAASPLTDLMAAEGSRALAEGLPRIIRERQDHEGYIGALYGAYLGGAVMAVAGTGLHHRVCHVLGGSFNLPHSETHSVILPYVVSFNREAAPEAMSRLSTAFNRPDPARAIFELARTLDAPRSLKELGMPENGLAEVARMIMENPPWNPRSLNFDNLLILLHSAYNGDDSRII